MGLKYFGTDGIRGPYGGPQLNDAIAFRAGLAAVRLLVREGGEESPLMVVGRDTRASGVALLVGLTAGFESGGGRVQSIGVAPTPAIAYVVKQSDASIGCAITASHNPSSDNGLKFFQSNGAKPTEAFELDLDSELGKTETPTAVEFRSVADGHAEEVQKYVDAVSGAFEPGFLSGKRIALDCANGALSGIAKKVFEHFGASIDVLGNEPDGENINAGVGSECPEAIARLYQSGNYDFGLAFDGDGDRMIAFDEAGSKLSGEAVLGLLAIRSKEKGALAACTLVSTEQSNLGLDAALSSKGITVERVGIGDKFVSRLMAANGYSLGGEESGHVVNGDFSNTGDGLFAGLRVAQAVVETGRKLSELAAFYVAFPQETRAIAVSSKPPLSECPHLSRTIHEIEEEFGSEGRLLVRYSGTEPKLRLLVEGKTDSLSLQAIEKLEVAVRKDLG